MRLSTARLLDTSEILFVYPQLIHTALREESTHSASYPASAEAASWKPVPSHDFAQLQVRS